MPKATASEAREFVDDIVEAGTPMLKDFAELVLELTSNREMQAPGDAQASALRQTFPHAPASMLRTGGPVLRDPESYATWFLTTSNLYVRTIGDNEFVRVTGSDDDQPAVITQHKAVQRAFTMPGHQSTYWKVLGDVASFGIGWMEDPVEMIHRMRLGPERRDVGAGASVQDYTPQYAGRRDLKWRYIHPLDFIPDWSSDLGAEMKFGVKIGRMAASHFKDFIEGLPEDAKDEAALARALAKNDKDYHFGAGIGEKWRLRAVRRLNENEMSLPERFRPVQFWHFGGEVPWEAIDSPRRYYSIIIANDEVVAQGPHPYYPHLWRCIKLPPMGGRPIPMSPLEVARYEQDELDTWRMLRTAAAIKTINAPTLIDSSVFDDASQFEEPASDQVIVGRANGIPGGVTAAAGQLNHNYGWLFAADDLLQKNREWLRNSTGLVDVIRGVAAGSRTTKREIEELSAAGNLPMNAQVDLIENEDLPAIARDVPQRLLLALRDHETPDQELAERIAYPQAELAHLAEDLSIQFVGSQRFQAKAGLGGMATTIAVLAAANPQLQSLLNMPQFAVDLLNTVSPDAAQRYMLDPSAALGQSAFIQATSPPRPGVASQPRQGGGGGGG